MKRILFFVILIGVWFLFGGAEKVRAGCWAVGDPVFIRNGSCNFSGQCPSGGSCRQDAFVNNGACFTQVTCCDSYGELGCAPSCSGTCLSEWREVGSCGGNDNCSGICDCGCGSGCGDGNADTRCNYDSGENQCRTSKDVCSGQDQSTCGGRGCTWVGGSECMAGTVRYANGSCGELICTGGCGDTIPAGQGASCTGNLAVHVRLVANSSVNCSTIGSGAALSGVTVNMNGQVMTSSDNTFYSLTPGSYSVSVTGVPTGVIPSWILYCNQTTTVTAGATADTYIGLIKNPTITGSFFDASYLTNTGGCSTWNLMNASQKAALRLAGSLTIEGGGNTYNENVVSSGTTGFSQIVDTALAPVTYNVSNLSSGALLLRWAAGCSGLGVTYSGMGASGNPDPTVLDFGFWRNYSGWWQARGGSIYAGSNITSTIPSSCNVEDGCEPYLVRSRSNQTGVAIHKTGAITLGGATNASVSPGGLAGQYTNANVQAVSGPDAGTGIYNYTYFVNKTTNYPKTVWTGTGKPTYSNPGGIGYEIYTRTGAATIDFSPIGTEKMIFLVNGNVTVAGDVTVPIGATLTVIASGRITFASTADHVEGQYIANDLVFSADTDQFTGEGNFIGYTGITFSRSLTIPGNNTAPAELFTFRPDLIVNAPEALKTTTGVWREVTP